MSQARWVGLLVMGMVLSVAGCASPTAREAALARSGPKVTHQSDVGYYAACSDQTPGSHVGPWVGPLRSSRADALQDAVDHDRLYPGHRASVVHY